MDTLVAKDTLRVAVGFDLWLSVWVTFDYYAGRWLATRTRGADDSGPCECLIRLVNDEGNSAPHLASIETIDCFGAVLGLTVASPARFRIVAMSAVRSAAVYSCD